MFTIFHVFVLFGLAAGAAAGGILAAKYLGWTGRILGTLVGAWVGGIIGNIPYLMTLKWIAREILKKSTDELRAELHDGKCLTPNLLLLELNRRGEDIRGELPLVLEMLTSEDTTRRGPGWAALTSAFPELSRRVKNYRVNDSVEVCRQKIDVLRGELGESADASLSRSPITYHGTAIEVLVGDHVEFKLWLFFWEGWQKGRVEYVPGISPKNSDLERDGMKWVGISGEKARTAVLVHPNTNQVRHTLRFVSRSQDDFKETPGIIALKTNRSRGSPSALV